MSLVVSVSGFELNILERCPSLHSTSLRPGPQGAPLGPCLVRKLHGSSALF